MSESASAPSFNPDALFPDGAILPSHGPDCFVCGADNAAGFQLVVRRDGDTVVADYIFGDRHVGAPGVAHGGAVSAVCDDLFGFILYLVGTAAVTRTLTVDYLRAVRLGVPYRIVARLDRHEGRRLFLSLTGHDADGDKCFTGTAVFVTVSIERLLQHAEGDTAAFGRLHDSFRPDTD